MGAAKGCWREGGRRRAHEVKRRDKFSKATDKYTVDPQTGDVYDPNGDYVGNLDEVRG